MIKDDDYSFINDHLYSLCNKKIKWNHFEAVRNDTHVSRKRHFRLFRALRLVKKSLLLSNLTQNTRKYKKLFSQENVTHFVLMKRYDMQNEKREKCAAGLRKFNLLERSTILPLLYSVLNLFNWNTNRPNNAQKASGF